MFSLSYYELAVCKEQQMARTMQLLFWVGHETEAKLQAPALATPQTN